jgi:hypothetical protein
VRRRQHSGGCSRKNSQHREAVLLEYTSREACDSRPGHEQPQRTTTDGSTDDELDQLGVWKFGLLIECIYRLDETRGRLSDAAYKERMRRFLDAAHKECERLNRSQEAVDAVYTERLDELLGAAQMAFERLDELKEAENAQAEESIRRAEDESLSSMALPGENITTEIPHVIGNNGRGVESRE